MRKSRKYHPPYQKKKKAHQNTKWKTIAFLGCAFLAVAYVGIYGANFLNPQNFQIPSLNNQEPSYQAVANYQSNYRVGSIATDSSGNKGYAIVNDEGKGQYQVVPVYLDQSKKGWHTSGPETREWRDYKTIEQQNPVIWSGGIMDITHIPDKDWSIPENWNSGSGPGYDYQSTASTGSVQPANANSRSTISPIQTSGEGIKVIQSTASSTAPLNSPNYQTSPKQHSLKYSSSADTIKFTTYGGLSDYFTSKPTSYYHDFVSEMLLPRMNDPEQKNAMLPLLNEIKNKAPDSKKQAMVAIGMVQHMPYGVGGEWEYPYTAVHLERGVCGDKSLLTAYLLKELGYDVVIFDWTGYHMALGIKSNVPGFRNTGYAYVETTRPTIPTYYPFADDTSMNGNPDIIHLTSGGNSIDFTEEYRDADLYTNLILQKEPDQTRYNQFMALTEKYDIYYDTF